MNHPNRARTLPVLLLVLACQASWRRSSARSWTARANGVVLLVQRRGHYHPHVRPSFCFFNQSFSGAK
jgi:hypothetical protein